MGRTRFAILLALSLALGAVGSTAAAQDAQVVKRITKYGKLSRGEAKRLAKNVSKRMKRAADMTGQQDALRSAVSRALFNTPQPADQMAAAKVRLRLYGGLNAWALDNLFKPRPGAIATCTRDLGVKRKQCEALIAAGGKISLADARKLGAGNAVAAAQQRRFGQQPQRRSFGQQPQQRRFGQQGQQRSFGQQQQRFGQRQQPQRRPAARPAPAARPMAPQKSVAQRKAEYQARRKAYLERKKAEMEARKAKIVGNAGGERAERGPASEDEAAAAGLPPPKKKPSAKKAQTASTAPAAAESPKPKKSKKADPALDEGFLGDLLGDPLGEK